MAMLHPKFNHLGRSKRKLLPMTKDRQKALAKHAAFLRKFGLQTSPRSIAKFA